MDSNEVDLPPDMHSDKSQTSNQPVRKPCLRNMMNQSRARAIKLQQDFQKNAQKTQK